MLSDVKRQPRMPNPARKSLGEKLRAALLDLAGGHGTVERHAERSWASITFAGTRHTVDLAFEGDDAIAAAERLIAELPDHEFAIPGQLVADAIMISIDHAMLPNPRLDVTVELLLLEEG
ncbi:hypothetical protein [Altererythrobacter sp. ZODW24]|uniref:hypothetical protein n=1 Tax=Altererythrobacter sp. ZODW24 TaxID=2185142 RepID=UPI001F071B89|nr:hypothetical protein [Altererythrobacter sp. ZODW24]